MGLLENTNTKELSRSIKKFGQESFGMIYLEQDWEKIKEIYDDNTDHDGIMFDRSISKKDIKNQLDQESNSENSPLQRIRSDSSVYFMDLIKMGSSNEEGGLDTVTPKILDIYEDKVIIDTITFAEEFNISTDDAGFYISKLMDREYLEKIETGVNSYYVIGEFLRTKYDITSLVDNLKREAENGILSQTSLSSIISVDAKEDVIKYLETTKGVILDLGGNFLILDDEQIENFAEARADEIKDTVDQTLEKKWHILTVEELQGYIEENLESRQNSDYPEALQRAETLNMREDIFTKTLNHIERKLDLEKHEGLYIRDGFEDRVDEKANQAVEEAEGDSPTSAENWEDLAMTKLDKSELSSSPSVVNHFDEKSRDRIQTIIDSKMGGGE